eukprot:3550336-Pleurochrysis_carterae.AAC.2
MAETCTVDAVLTSTLPVIDHSEAFASIHDLYAPSPAASSSLAPTRKRANRAGPSQSPPPRNAPPLRPDGAPARPVITA